MATRRERVVLDLESNVAPGVLRDAAAVAALTRELKGLSGQSVSTARTTQAVSRDVDRISASSVKADRSINQLTGRLRLMADIAATLGPAVIPLGAVGIAGLAGLASQMGFTVVAAGVLVGSLQGVGDALEAMQKARLEPTAENLAEVETVMRRLTPAARDFAREAFALLPALRALRDVGAEQLFPGLTRSISDIERVLPRFAGIMSSVAEASGEIAADAAGSLASGRWDEFFQFVENEAPESLADLASIIGDVTHGLASLWADFDPVSDDFSTWLVGVADGFDQWAQGLAQTQGFAEFVDYVRTNGPVLADTLQAVADAVLQIVEAAAPLAGPTLRTLEAVATVVASIADSDLGTPIMAGVAALAAYNRMLTVTAQLQKRMDASATAGGGGVFGFLGDRQAAQKSSLKAVKADVAALGTMWPSALARTSNEQARMAATTKSLRSNLGLLSREAGRSAGPVAGIGLAATGAADNIGLTNTVSLALIGTLGGPAGMALGAAAGGFLDLAAAGRESRDALAELKAATDSSDLDALTAAIERQKKALADDRDIDWGSGFLGLGDLAQRIGTDINNTIHGDLTNTYGEQEAAIAATGDRLAELTALQNASATDRRYLAMLARQTAELEANVAALKAKQDATLAAFDAETAYRQALKAAHEQGKKNNAGIKGSSDAALENRGIISSLAAAWNSQSAAVKENESRYRAARREFINAAVEMGVTRGEAKRLAGELLHMPRNIAIKTTLRDEASAKAKAIRDALASIKDKTVTVRITQSGTAAVSPGFGVDAKPSADGSTVPKDGRPYADRYLYALAPGEEIISNRHGQADKNRAALKAANAGAKLAVVGYSNGGTSGSMVGPDGRTGVAVIGGVVQEQDTRFKTSREDRLAMLKLEKEIRELVRDLRATGKDSLKGVERRLALTELAQARRELQAAHQAPVLKRDETGLQRSIEVLTAELEANSATLTEATSTHQGWLEKMSATGQAAVAGFNTGLFERDSNIWAAAAAGGWSANVDRDIAGLNERDALIAQLEAAGLTGEALAAALAQGSNADLAGVLQRGEAAAMQKKFTERAALQASVAGHAGTAAFGREAAAAGAVVAALEAQVQGQTAELEEANVRLEAIQRAIEGQGPRVGAAAAEGIRQGGNRVARRRRRD